jgi:hypothetical protein
MSKNAVLQDQGAHFPEQDRAVRMGRTRLGVRRAFPVLMTDFWITA